MPKNKYILVYITAPGRREALRLGDALLAERLVACIHVLGPVMSRYWWQGRRAQAREWLLLAKSRAALASRIIRRVRALHSYAVPCVVALPLAAGHSAFLDWIGRETAARQPRRQRTGSDRNGA